MQIHVEGKKFFDGDKVWTPIGIVSPCKYLNTDKDCDLLFGELSDHGANCVRIPMDNYMFDSGCDIEGKGLGDFSSADAIVDRVIKFGMKHDIRLILQLFMPNIGTFKKHAFYVHGPMKGYLDFFSPQVEELIYQRFNYFMTAWASEQIMAWCLAEELSQKYNDWALRLVTFSRRISKSLVYLSTAQPTVGDVDWAQWVIGDFISFKGYGQDMLFYPWIPAKGSECVKRRHLVGALNVLAEAKKRAMPSKPLMDTETPYTPYGFGRLAWGNWKLLGVPQEQLDNCYYLVGKQLMLNGSVNPGMNWGKMSKGMLKYMRDLHDEFC